MTDIHAHIIPFVDDGCKSLSESIDILKEMVKQGVSNIICTPHYRHPHNRSTDSIKRHFDELVNEAKKENLPIKLFLGQEIYTEEDIIDLLKEEKVLTMNGTNYVLLEFDFSLKCDIVEAVYKLSRAGYIPIVAHVERYPYVTVDDVYDIKLNGGLIQVNAVSIVGKTKGVNKKFVKKLFKEGFVDFVASDVHYGRENFLGEAYKTVKKKYGVDAADVVFKLNAEILLKVRQ